ncbi:MAG: hypothetical protein PVG22_13785 [Chromatiales bacterium]|jgi:hypothetical protein
MKYRLPLIYKHLLILSVVLGPILWLMFSEDGQRRTDTMVLWLFGEEEISMDLRALSGQYTEQEMARVYAKLNWYCSDLEGIYGNRHCVARIGIFNMIPARYLTAFYRDGRLTALKLHYRAHNHGQLQSLLLYQLGDPDPSTVSPGGEQGQVLQWRTHHGLVLMKKELIDEEEPALFWLSSDLVSGAL